MIDQQTRPAVAGRNVPLRGRRALVAEASNRARGLLCAMLAELGASEVVELERGAAVIDALRMQPFDIVIIGQVRGDAYDAPLVLEKMREDRLVRLAATVVVVAADRETRTITSLASHAPDTCLVRPLVPSQVRLRLIEVVAHKDRLRPVMEAVDNDDWQTALAVCRLFEPASLDLRLAGYRAICEHLIGYGLLDDAQAVLAEARNAAQVPWIRFAEARIHQIRGETAEARALLEQLLGERPEFIASYDALAGIESAQGEFAQALSHLQEASHRAGFSLSRTRSSGEVAARGGNLHLAEKLLDRVMQRVQNSDLARGSDYVHLADVLSARGKHVRAEKLASEMQRTQVGDPDGAISALLVRFRRARDEDEVAQANELFGKIVEDYRAARDQLSLTLLIQLMENFMQMNERELAYDAARAVAASGRADRARLDRVRAVLRS